MSILRKTLLVFALCLAWTTFSHADEGVTETQTTDPHQDLINLTGTEKVTTVQKDYTSGKYDTFLRAIQEKYMLTKDTPWVKALLAKGEYLIQSDEWKDLYSNMVPVLKTRNEALRELCSDKGNEGICGRVASATGLIPEVEDELNPADLTEFMLSEEATQDETSQTVADLEREYWIKGVLVNANVTAEHGTKNELWIVLQLEKWGRIEEVIEGHEDHPLFEKIQTAIDVAPLIWAKGIDNIYLVMLAKGVVSPQDETETEVQNIVKESEAQALTLYQAYLKAKVEAQAQQTQEVKDATPEEDFVFPDVEEVPTEEGLQNGAPVDETE